MLVAGANAGARFTGSVVNFPIANGTPIKSISTSLTAAEAETTFSVAGTLSMLSISIATNGYTSGAASTVQIRKNGANGNQLVSYTSATGVLTDVTNTDAVTVGDVFSCAVTAGGNGGDAQSYGVVSAMFQATSDTSVIAKSAPFATAATDNLTAFVWPSSNTGWNTTESRAQVRARASFRLEDLQAIVSTNTRTSAITIKSRVNGADGAQSFSVGSTATGTFTDATNTDAVSGTDLFCIAYTNGVGTGTVTARYGVTLTNVTDGKTRYISANATLAYSATGFLAIAGNRERNSSGANAVAAPVFYSATVSDLFVSIAANTRDGTLTYTVEKTGVDTAITVSVPTLTTGIFEDNTNTTTVVSGDTLVIEVVVGGTTGNNIPSIIALTIEETVPGSTPQIPQVIVFS